MLEQLETIPVWDGLKSDSECFLCSLMEEAEKDGIRYYLSSAIMTPEIRVKTNEYGFCPKHSLDLAAALKPQPLSLVMDTYYEEERKLLQPDFDRMKSASNPRKAQKILSSLFDTVDEREKGCLVCSRMKERLDRYTFTIASLFGEDAEFRSALKESKGFCLHHSKALYLMAPQALKGDMLLDFYRTLSDLMERNLERVQKDDWWMSQKYKSENREKPWNGCEDASYRAVQKLVGRARVIDPANEKKGK